MRRVVLPAVVLALWVGLVGSVAGVVDLAVVARAAAHEKPPVESCSIQTHVEAAP